MPDDIEEGGRRRQRWRQKDRAREISLEPEGGRRAREKEGKRLGGR